MRLVIGAVIVTVLLGGFPSAAVAVEYFPVPYAGLTGSPWASGRLEREQGISKAGNALLRKTMVQLAWTWLRFQPDSALARWFKERTAGAKGRMRKIMAVALARKLLIALWRFAKEGVIPDGATLKSA